MRAAKQYKVSFDPKKHVFVLGCGKTELAAYAAAQTGSAFIKASAASMQSKYSGGTGKNVKMLFALAKQLKNAIIFIDEIDSVANDRSETNSSCEKQALFEILIQMNNLKYPPFKNVFVICATNSPSTLDDAIHRRFTFVHVGLPSHKDRMQLFEYYLNNNHSLKPKDFEYLACKTEGFSCSDIENIVKVAATFYYQEMYDNEIDYEDAEDEAHVKLIPKERKIAFSDVKFVVEKTTATASYDQIRDDEDFRMKHDCVVYPNKKDAQRKLKNVKLGIWRRIKLWFFGTA